ncbi:MAG: T9SS type A sorting domain-containing protein [Bacteroidales bacterium]|jgi:hypothetical protein|nr:T9SS type A sorting domain-containing protein [Bacteroidales bacterium]
MKRSITPFLAFVLLIATATAQGEWKWAHYWSGSDGSYSSYYNYITNTAFDNEGNLYVFGAMGNNPVYDGESFEYCSEAMTGGANNPSILLAKFDTLGNMLWYKVVKSSEGTSDALWMEVKDNRIVISGSTVALEDVEYYYNSKWFYYLDTLITGAQVHNIPAEERQFPFRPGRYTFFATLDKDGNLLDQHFVEAFTRDLHINGSSYTQAPECLCYHLSGTCPFHVDAQGNTYVYTWFQYGGNEENPYTIVVDGDTNKTYNLFLPGNTDMAIGNAMLYKFTPEWTLDFAHLLVNHTDGIATPYELTGDSVNPLFNCNLQGLSFDEEDNMYLSGYIQIALCTESYGVNLHNYPVHLWWDESHCLTINDQSSSQQANFIIKYNPDGQVVWSNQIYTRGGLDPNSNEGYTRVSWLGNYYYDNSVWIIGGGYYNGENALIYFDNEENPLRRFLSADHSIVFVARFNSISGEYINHAIVPASQPMPSKSPFVFNDRVLALSSTNISYNEAYITQWDMNGNVISVIDTITFNNYFDATRSSGLLGNAFGHLSAGLLCFGSVTFGNGVSVNCPTSQSNAAFALYHDPELLVPYVKVPEYKKPTSSLHLYPNPASTFIFVDCGKLQPEAIFIFDENGRELRRVRCNNDTTVVNLMGLPAGTYFLKTVGSDGTSAVGKFVKVE